MSYEVYRYIFWGGAILAIIMLIVSIILFVVLKIPTVIGDLTGSNARKAIEDIRRQNSNSGQKTYRSSHVNRERGRVTDKISASGTLIKNPTHTLHGSMETEKIQTQKIIPTMVAPDTTVLNNERQFNNETTVLDVHQPFCSEETSVLNQNVNENYFEIVKDITYVHSNEVID